jgi:eukaryotic-like serine/threonine-protein kinase
MADLWKQSEGQVVDNKYTLQQYLAGTEHSAVFVTETPAPKAQKAAIKFIAADPATADRQLTLWARASKLSHPNLLRVLDSGRCRLSRMDLLFVVLEFAEEDLSQVVPERALSPSETRDMIGPLLDALSHLHAKNFVHSHVSPANIHAAGDQLKLSCDTIVSIGDSRVSVRPPEIYDAPESSVSAFSPPADVWGLGATLVEVLTQRAPSSPLDNQSNPMFPDTLPQPFLEIVRHALRIDSKSRWTIAEIRASLTPAMAAAAAGQAVAPAPAPSAAASQASIAPAPVVSATASAAASPLAVPLSPVEAVPAAKLPAAKRDTPPPKPQPARQQPAMASAPKQGVVLPNYVVPVLALVFIIVAIIALPKILEHRPDSSQTTSASTQPASRPNSTGPVAGRESAPPPVKSASSSAAKNAAEKKSSDQRSITQSSSTNAAAPSPAPASLRTDTPAPTAPAKSSSSSAARGDVLDQVLPDVSDKARATIHGRVRVGVRVHVDAAGNVSTAELDSPGPSKYFADLSLNAVRRWVFTAPEIDGRSAPSEWLIRFEFTQSGTKAYPTQTAP